MFLNHWFWQIRSFGKVLDGFPMGAAVGDTLCFLFILPLPALHFPPEKSSSVTRLCSSMSSLLNKVYWVDYYRVVVAGDNTTIF